MKYKLNPFEKLVLILMINLPIRQPVTVRQMRSRLVGKINEATQKGEIEDAP